MDGGPLFSILIPTYNVEPWIGRCLDSVLGQTYGDLEVRVHDDGSCDGTLEAVARHSDGRVVVTRSDRNEGTMDALRRLKDFRGRYVLYVDGDDELAPDALETLVPLIRDDPGTGMWIMPIGEIWGEARTDMWRMPAVDASTPDGIWRAWEGSADHWLRWGRLVRADVAVASVPAQDVEWIVEDRFWGPTYWLNAGRIRTVAADRPACWYRRGVGTWDNPERRNAGRERSDRPEDVVRHVKEVVDLVRYHGASLVRHGIPERIADFCRHVSPAWCRERIMEHPEPFRRRMLAYVDAHFTRDGMPTDYMLRLAFAAAEGLF